MTFMDTSATQAWMENLNKVLCIINKPFEWFVVCFFIPVLLDFWPVDYRACIEIITSYTSQVQLIK